MRIPRLIARKTNNYIIAQIIETKHAQDKVVIGITSKVLLKKGWPDSKAGSLKNLPSAYLTGFVIGKLAKDKKIKSAIFDMGMNRNIHKSRLMLFLRGAIDAGLSIPHNPDALPSTDSIKKYACFMGAKNKTRLTC